MVMLCMCFYFTDSQTTITLRPSDQCKHVSKSKNDSVIGPEQNYEVFDISVTSL